MNLTTHFSEEELLRTDTGLPNELPAGFRCRLLKVATKLERAREILGGPILITSGYRAPAVNHAVGGSTTSVHMFALAADFNPTGMDRETAFRKLWADFHWMEDVDQLIFERGCIHMGLSLGSARRWAHADVQDPVRGRTYPRIAVWQEALPEVLPHA